MFSGNFQKSGSTLLAGMELVPIGPRPGCCAWPMAPLLNPYVPAGIVDGSVLDCGLWNTEKLLSPRLDNALMGLRVISNKLVAGVAAALACGVQAACPKNSHAGGTFTLSTSGAIAEGRASALPVAGPKVRGGPNVASAAASCSLAS